MKLVLSLILSFIFLLWFISSVVGMFYVSRSAEYSWLLPMILGQVFLVIGTAGLIVMLRAKKKDLWIDIAAIVVGAIIVVLPLIYHYGSEQTKAAITAHIPTLAGVGLLPAGYAVRLQHTSDKNELPKNTAQLSRASASSAKLA